MKELLRNPEIFDRVVGDLKVLPERLFGMAEDIVSSADDDDFYFQAWAEDQPEVIKSKMSIGDIIKNADQAKQIQKADTAAAFILYTNYPRPASVLDMSLFSAIYSNNSYPFKSKAKQFVESAAPSILGTLLSRYAAMERGWYKFNESKIYESILRELMKYSN